MNTEELQLLLKASPELLNFIAKEREHEAKKEFFKALCGFQAECPIIGKEADAGAGTFRYKYADTASIKHVIAPLMCKHGLSLSIDTNERESGYEIICRVHHTGGWTQNTRIMIAIDQKARMNDTQKSGAALTYGIRYVINAALFVVVGKDDDDAQSLGGPHGHSGGRRVQEDYRQNSAYSERQIPEGFTEAVPTESNDRPITEKQKKRLEARINEFGLSRDKIKIYCTETWGISHFDDLNRSQYRELDGIIDKIAAKKSAAPKEEMMEEVDVR